MEQNIRLKEKKSADEQIRLNKFLSDAGYCSRREADRLVEQGVVKVNGKTAVMGQKVTINDSIMVKGKNISREEEQIVNNILKGSNYHEKEYVVTVDKPVTDDFIKKMSTGVRILDQVTRPCKVAKVKKHVFNIVLTQGLNRQIRRMCGELGYNVQKLKRIRIMNIELGNLPVGQYRKVTDSELKELMRNFN